MALINCPECGKEISDSASSCPNCGYSLKKETTTKSNLTRVGLILNIVGNVLSLCLVLIVVVFLSNDKQYAFSYSLKYNLISTGIVIASIVFLNLSSKRRLSIIYGIVLLILNFSLVFAILSNEHDFCSIGFYIIGLICSFIGVIFIFIEGLSRKK